MDASMEEAATTSSTTTPAAAAVTVETTARLCLTSVALLVSVPMALATTTTSLLPSVSVNSHTGLVSVCGLTASYFLSIFPTFSLSRPDNTWM